MMEKRDLEIEQIYKYINKNNGVSVSNICKDLSFARYLVSEVIWFLLGSKDIVLHRRVGTINLYVATKQVIKDAS